MFKNRLTLKILSFLIFSDILETFTHFCFKKSALPESGLNITSLHEATVFIQAMLSSGFLWIGLISVLATFIIWSAILSKIDLSVAVPIASFSYILVPLVSIIFLGEQITLLRWIGILFILAGVIMVSLTSEDKKAALP